MFRPCGLYEWLGRGTVDSSLLYLAVGTVVTPGPVALLVFLDGTGDGTSMGTRLPPESSQLRGVDDDWNGYLFPSNRSRSGHRSTDTLRSWFRNLANWTGLPETIDGDTIHPHMGRRFWYDRYSSTMEDIFELAEDMAADQGSKSVSTILENYRNEGQLRKQRRRFMRERLAVVFE